MATYPNPALLVEMTSYRTVIKSLPSELIKPLGIPEMCKAATSAACSVDKSVTVISQSAIVVLSLQVPTIKQTFVVALPPIFKDATFFAPATW